MSHELRTPLTAIIDFSELIRDQAEAANVRISYDPNLTNVALQNDRRAAHQVAVESVGHRGQLRPGRGNAIVRAEQTTEGGVAVLVHDNGIGIDPMAMRSWSNHRHLMGTSSTCSGNTTSPMKSSDSVGAPPKKSSHNRNRTRKPESRFISRLSRDGHATLRTFE